MYRAVARDRRSAIPESRVARTMQNRTGLYGCKERVKSQSASNLSHRRTSLYSSGI